MMIQLRRKVPDPRRGARRRRRRGSTPRRPSFYKDVHIVVKNVGSNGILPGTAKPEKGGQTPLDLRADGEMRIDLPRPRPVVLVGPPDLDRRARPDLRPGSGPTSGSSGGPTTPDQLNSDTLDLTLMPGPKPAEPADGRRRRRPTARPPPRPRPPPARAGRSPS